MKDKIQGAMVLGLAVIVVILLKDKTKTGSSQAAAPGQTYLVQGGGNSGGGPVVNPINPITGASTVGGFQCPCYY